MAESTSYEDIIKLLYGPNPEQKIKEFFKSVEAMTVAETAKIRSALLKDLQVQSSKVTNQITPENIKNQSNLTQTIAHHKQVLDSVNAAEKERLRLLNQLSSATAKNTPENIKAAAALKSQREENRRLIAEQQKLNGTFKPGVVSGFISQIKNLAVAYIGLSSAINLVKNIFTTTKELDVLSQSYKYLINDTKELGDTQSFLTDITNRYGLELISTSQSYLKFRASIAGANFDLDKSRKIFESVSKAGSVLGLNAQRMELVFLALEQMISKGTVSMEELRRQLGDNLPGAMRIMADALGVNIPELLKMIKANEVLAEDALPKFAAQLEKSYGIESVKTIDNLQSAVNRLKNAWTKTVEEFKASTVFKDIVNFIARALESDDMEATAAKAKIVADAFKGINTELNKIKETGDSKAYENALVNRINESMLQMSKFKAELDAAENQIKQAQGGYVNKALLDDADEARVKYEAWLQIVRELDEMLSVGLKKEYTDVIPVTDETLEKLQKEVDLASGVIAKLEAKKALNEYLIRQSKDQSGSEQKRLIFQNEAYQKQINYLRDIVDYNALIRKETEEIARNVEKGTNETQDDISEALLKEYEAKIKAYDEGDERILELRNDFGEKIGLMDSIQYEEQIALLKIFHEERILTDEQYLTQRALLWLEYNEKLISAGDEFNQAFLGLLDEINKGQILAAQKELDIQERKLNDLKSDLDQEKKLKDEGKANDYDRLVAQIGETQRVRDEANKKLEKAQKREAQIQLAAQASDIVTASANIIESYSEIPIVGVILGLAAVASMITAFASYKNKINSMSKYAEGTEYLERGRNPKGRDTIPILADEGERIVPTRINAQLDGIDNDRLPEIYKFYKYNMLRGSGAVQINTTREVVQELKKSRSVSQEMLIEMKNKPEMYQLKDGRVLIVRGRHNTQILNP